jgi:fido (protein-threonine AMPylation protein)
MFCDVWEWAGKPRQFDLNLGVTWYRIPEHVLSLTRDLSFWDDSNMPLIEQTTRLHHRAVKIHPFRNGNGRWSRLLVNIRLEIHKQPLIFWPEEIIGQASRIRDSYIKALQDADRGDYEPLLALHNQYQNP